MGETGAVDRYRRPSVERCFANEFGLLKDRRAVIMVYYADSLSPPSHLSVQQPVARSS